MNRTDGHERPALVPGPRPQRRAEPLRVEAVVATDRFGRADPRLSKSSDRLLLVCCPHQSSQALAIPLALIGEVRRIAVEPS